ncbi:hypothetical protein J3Q64DRAFT_1172843 [Phycomyces blakesleeanus]|uniref:BAG domain-containing protein n=1 Tax=Phycomyces blakesleeanus TaxID=4837 RepID=A0ABR3AVY3_PHYBL
MFYDESSLQPRLLITPGLNNLQRTLTLDDYLQLQELLHHEQARRPEVHVIRTLRPLELQAIQERRRIEQAINHLKLLQEHYRRQRFLQIERYLQNYKRQALLRQRQEEEAVYRQYLAAALEQRQCRSILENFKAVRRQYERPENVARPNQMADRQQEPHIAVYNRPSSPVQEMSARPVQKIITVPLQERPTSPASSYGEEDEDDDDDYNDEEEGGNSDFKDFHAEQLSNLLKVVFGQKDISSIPEPAKIYHETPQDMQNVWKDMHSQRDLSREERAKPAEDEYEEDDDEDEGEEEYDDYDDDATIQASPSQLLDEKSPLASFLNTKQDQPQSMETDSKEADIKKDRRSEGSKTPPIEPHVLTLKDLINHLVAESEPIYQQARQSNNEDNANHKETPLYTKDLKSTAQMPHVGEETSAKAPSQKQNESPKDPMHSFEKPVKNQNDNGSFEKSTARTTADNNNNNKKSATETARKEPTKESAKEPVKEPVKESTKESAKESFTASAKGKERAIPEETAPKKKNQGFTTLIDEFTHPPINPGIHLSPETANARKFWKEKENALESESNPEAAYKKPVQNKPTNRVPSTGDHTPMDEDPKKQASLKNQEKPPKEDDLEDILEDMLMMEPEAEDEDKSEAEAKAKAKDVEDEGEDAIEDEDEDEDEEMDEDEDEDEDEDDDAIGQDDTMVEPVEESDSFLTSDPTEIEFTHADDPETKARKLHQLREIQARLDKLQQEQEIPVLASNLTFQKAERGVNKDAIILTANTPDNRAFLSYEDAIMRTLLELDTIESNGDEMIKCERRGMVKRAEALLEKIDQHRAEEWRKSRKTEKTKLSKSKKKKQHRKHKHH